MAFPTTAYVTPEAPTTLFPGIKFASSSAGGAIASGLGVSKDYVLLDVTASTGDFPDFNSGDEADICRLLFAILFGIQRKYAAVATPANLPATWVAALSPTIDASTGNITRNFYNQFTTTVSGEEVLATT